MIRSLPPFFLFLLRRRPSASARSLTAPRARHAPAPFSPSFFFFPRAEVAAKGTRPPAGRAAAQEAPDAGQLERWASSSRPCPFSPSLPSFLFSLSRTGAGGCRAQPTTTPRSAGAEEVQVGLAFFPSLFPLSPSPGSGVGSTRDGRAIRASRRGARLPFLSPLHHDASVLERDGEDPPAPLPPPRTMAFFPLSPLSSFRQDAARDPRFGTGAAP